MATIKASTLRVGVASSCRPQGRPFAAARPAGRATLRVRAAEVDAPAGEDLDFQFSFSDAKKNNEYSAGDVEAALRFYQDGEGSAPLVDADFVTNNLGMEDASFFDDIDNNEGYEEDEYLVAGIPEAAPKKRRDGRRGQGADDGEGDDMEQAKSLDRMKAMEDRMVLEAALEEEFGDAKQAESAEGSKLKLWDWLVDGSTDLITGADMAEAQNAMGRNRSGVSMVSDREVTLDIARVKPEIFDNAEVREYLELFANDDLSEDVLAATNIPLDGEDPSSTITDAELARLSALADQKVPEPSFKDLPQNTVPVLIEDAGLDSEVVDSYIESLRAAFKAGAPEAEVKAAFAGEALTEDKAGAVDNSKDKAELLAYKIEDIPEVTVDYDSVIAELEAEQEDDDEGLEAELRALAAMDVMSPEDIPTAEELELAEQYLVTAEDYVAQEEARKQEIAAAVARGELSADSLAEELEEVADAEAELLAMGEDDEEAEDAVEDEDDGEQWVERIIEMTRVTKVVKGGKIMGFRCVAIVGNGNGLVGVGCAAGREIAVAVKRTLVDARKNVIRVPLVGENTIPHKAETKFHAGRVVLVPASGGTGCIAGGVVRSVLELAGVQNCLAKRLGSRSPLNTARATVKALASVQTLEEVSKSRGVPMAQLLQLQ